MFITESRQFPDITNEGVATLGELGNVALLEISLCGGGGVGGGVSDASQGSAGGSGGGFQNFRVINADGRFQYLDVSLGAAGNYDGFNSSVGPATGGSTIVTGISVTSFYLNLIGYGGGPGANGGSSARWIAGGGGGGGGPGKGGGGLSGNGDGTSSAGGPSGKLGGLKGGDGVSPNSSIVPLVPPEVGGYRLPWRSGSGGGFDTFRGFYSPGAPFQGGYDVRPFNLPGGKPTTGGASLFGRGAVIPDFLEPNPGYCGGGPAASFNINNQGGAGAALMRYYIR